MRLSHTKPLCFFWGSDVLSIFSLFLLLEDFRDRLLDGASLDSDEETLYTSPEEVLEVPVLLDLGLLPYVLALEASEDVAMTSPAIPEAPAPATALVPAPVVAR